MSRLANLEQPPITGCATSHRHEHVFTCTFTAPALAFTEFKSPLTAPPFVSAVPPPSRPPTTFKSNERPAPSFTVVSPLASSVSSSILKEASSCSAAGPCRAPSPTAASPPFLLRAGTSKPPPIVELSSTGKVAGELAKFELDVQCSTSELR